MDLSPTERRSLANRDRAYSLLVRSLPHQRVEAHPELLLVDSGTPLAELNVAFVGPSPGDASAVVRTASRFFEAHHGAWRLEVAVHLRELFRESLEPFGLTEAETRPGLLLDPADLRPTSPPSDVSVTTVDTAEDSRTFAKLLVSGFGMPPIPVLLSAAFHEVRGWRCYLGWVAGEPVATAMRLDHDGVTGIYCISTIEAARRRGYGRAITEYAVRDGLAEGSTSSFLQASAMGLPVYSAMGYRRVFEHVSWTSPAGSDPRA